MPTWLRTALAGLALAATGLTLGCGSGGTAATPSTTVASQPTTVAAQPPPAATPPPAPAATPQPASLPDSDGRFSRREGGRHGIKALPTLPQGWPEDLALPPGTLVSAGGAGTTWNALLLVGFPADVALTQAETYYRSAGYTQVKSGVLQRGRRTVTIVTENQDHSENASTVTVSSTGG